jgi:hypothetical protein
MASRAGPASGGVDVGAMGGGDGMIIIILSDKKEESRVVA